MTVTVTAREQQPTLGFHSAKDQEMEGLSMATSNKGSFCEETAIEGVFCKDAGPEGSDVSATSLSGSTSSSSSSGPVTETSKVEGVFCNDLPLKDPTQDSNGISNSAPPPSPASTEPDPDAASPAIFSRGVSAVIGRRSAMEDFVAVAPAFLTISGEAYDFFAVYDGHGGSEVAELCRDRMHAVVAEEAERLPPPPAGSEKEWWSGVMERSFERVDADAAGMRSSVGSTAVVAVVGPRMIVVANCGDCRAVMWRDGEALPLSTDHKPYRFDELARIERSGGWVVNWHGFRVQGVLAISRSVGDYDLKPHVISTPELTVINRTDKDEFLILASDGLWDVISNIVACRVVRNCLTGRSAKRYPDSVKGHTAGIAASLLTRMAFSQRSLDNVSAVVIQFADLLE